MSDLFPGQYKRLDRDGQFRTMMTSVKPNGMNGSVVLHPTVRLSCLLGNTILIAILQQKRILTVRECARAQGFPDSYEFLSPHSVPAKIVDDVGTIYFYRNSPYHLQNLLANETNRQRRPNPSSPRAGQGTWQSVSEVMET